MICTSLFLAVFQLCSIGQWCMPIKTDAKGSSAASKKGTIRIAGPWHSESTLDRNVDPSEDTYVKKIISSNEGLNYNKDMAEAGEMFDVNGIDDIYDKNALITYEVNGHEIPVHMRPKFTPQTKTLFPEYVHDTPAAMAMGSARQPSKAFTQRSSNGKFYKTPKFASLKTSVYSDHSSSPMSSHSIETQKFFHTQTRPSSVYNDNHLPWKTVESVGRVDKPDEFFMGKSNNDPVGEENKLIDQNHRVPETNMRSNSYRYHHDKPNINIQDLPVEDKLSNPNSYLHKENTENTDSPSEHETIHSFSQDRNDENKNVHEQLDNDASLLHHALEKPSGSDEVAMFGKLADITQRLVTDTKSTTSDGTQHDSGDNGHGEESINVEKTKSKTKILSLLGELSEKLKGMEAIVTSKHGGASLKSPKDDYSEHSLPEQAAVVQNPTQNYKEQESVEKFDKDQEPSSDQFDLSSHREKPDEFFKNKELDETSGNHFPASVRENHILKDSSNENFKERLPTAESQSLQVTENERTEGEVKSSLEGETSTEGQKLLHDKFTQDSGSPGLNLLHEVSSEREHEPEIIERYREESKPFIMDTHAIDYRPAESEESIESEELHHHTQHPNRKTETYDDKENDRYEPHAARKTDTRDEQVDDDQYTDDKENEEDENEDSRHRHARHHKHKKYHGKRKAHRAHTREKGDLAHKKNDHETKVDDIEESLAEADEDDTGVARERTFHSPRHKLSEHIKYPNYADVKEAAVFETNLLRKRYHADRMKWSDALSDRAQQAAEKLAKQTDFDPIKIESYKKDPGENLAFIKFDSTNVGKDAIDYWTREAKKYDFISPFVTEKNSDFVQLIWKPSKEFGMGVAKSESGEGWIVTSYYDAPVVSSSSELRSHVQSDVPIHDPYTDIVG